MIDDFKDDICNALEDYSARIVELKQDMDSAMESAAAVSQDIAQLKNRFVTIEQGEKCTQCHAPLLLRQFYVFPCQHTFHADCLIGLVRPFNHEFLIVSAQDSFIGQGIVVRCPIATHSYTPNRTSQVGGCISNKWATCNICARCINCHTDISAVARSDANTENSPLVCIHSGDC